MVHCHLKTHCRCQLFTNRHLDYDQLVSDPKNWGQKAKPMANSISLNIFVENAGILQCQFMLEGLCNRCLTSLLTNLVYQPPHQPHLPASSPTSLTSLLTKLLYQPLPLAISKVECKAKDHVYIWDLYPTIREGKLEFLFESSIEYYHPSTSRILLQPIS